MRSVRILALGSLAVLALVGPAAQAGHIGWSIGIGIGAPVYYRPWWGPYYYYPPYPVVVQPAPVVVQPAPAMQAAPACQPACQGLPPAPVPVSAVTPTVARSVSPDEGPGDIDRNVQRLADPDDRVRAEAAITLGRERARRAVDPLMATLAGDRSPAVRETAARALGLIGAPQALPALQRAAQADADRDVRHSAQFAVEVVQTSSGR
jgi:hypothetical protein